MNAFLSRLVPFFLVFPSAIAALVSWDGGGDGHAWEDPLNWSADALPGADDDVVIADPAGTLWITNHAGHIGIRSLQSDASLVLEGGNLKLTGGVSEVRGTFILGSRKTLMVVGEDTTFRAVGAVGLDGVRFTVKHGANLTLDTLTNYTDSPRCCGGLWLVDGEGSVLSLPRLSTLTGNPTWSMKIQATSGGQVLLPRLVTIGNSRLGCLADGPGSVVDLPALAEFDDSGNRWLTLNARNEGVVNAPLLTDGRRVSIYLREGGVIPLAQFTNFTRGAINLGDGYDLTLPAVTTLDGADLLLSGGAKLTLPGVTAYADTDGCCGAVWKAEGAGSVLTLPNLAELTGNPNWAMNIQAFGGEVRLPALSVISDGHLHIQAGGSGSLALLEALTSFAGKRRFTLEAVGGGTVRLNPGTVTLPRTTLRLEAGSRLTAGVIELGAEGECAAAGTLEAGLINRGVVRPGASPGRLEIQGDYTQTAEGRLVIEVGGETPGENLDFLAVTGAATLDGTLEAGVVEDFAATAGQRFAVLSAASVNGRFAALADLSAGSDLEFAPEYAADHVAVVAGIAAGPRVVEAAPTGTVPAPLRAFQVTFSEMVDAERFTGEQVELAGPLGAVPVEPPTRIGETTWRITFPEQFAGGDYALTVHAEVTDYAGHPMAAPFVVRCRIVEGGPRIVAVTPEGELPASVWFAEVTFDKAVDPATFTPEDATLTGPGGQAIAIAEVQSREGDQRYRLRFAAPAEGGAYTLGVGPEIADPAGNLMDQDGDGVFGEAEEDRFVSSFVVHPPVWEGDFHLALGRASVLSGEAGFVSLRLASRNLTALEFVLHAPAAWMAGATLEPVSSDLLTASLTPRGAGRWAARFEFDRAVLIDGERELARLRFHPPADAPSVRLPLEAEELGGTAFDGTPLTDGVGERGQIIVVREAPVLDLPAAAAPPTLHGRPGAVYAIEAVSAFVPGAEWTVTREVTLNDRFLPLPDLAPAEGNRFYRAREVHPPPGN